MKKGQRAWDSDELILALSLYCQLTAGQMDRRNPRVIELAKLLTERTPGYVRTPGAVSRKLANFSSLDPARRKLGRVGNPNRGKNDEKIWQRFFGNIIDLAFESERLRLSLAHTSVERAYSIDEAELPRAGVERERIIKTRVNQGYFRRMILASYNNTCCVTGLKGSSLLVAAHISSWSQDEVNRMNPHNGLAFNALHDRAFEVGLMAITPDYKIVISPMLMDKGGPGVEDYFTRYHGKDIKLPTKFLPDPELLKAHLASRFINQE